MMSSRNKDERGHVNDLIKVIQKNSPGVYVHIDRDTGAIRHTSSGYDFLLASDGHVVFCEAKEENGKLSSWQKFTHAQVTAAGNSYRVVRFWENGKFFTVDGEKRVATKDATLQDFFLKG